ncbi:MAG: spore germination protein [Ruminiclostridium sp.]|nr:spore germination protein [Ruminiclostridium sp.]
MSKHKGVKFLAKFGRLLSSLLFFNEPAASEGFVLEENEKDKTDDEPGQTDYQREGGEVRHTRVRPDAEKKKDKKPDISKDLSKNLDFIKKTFSIPVNGDLILREFDVIVNNKVIPAFLIFIDGMTDRKVINDDILQPLMLLSNLDIKSDGNGVADYIRNHILPHNQLQEVQEHRAVINEVNFGGCGIYIDGIDSAFAADVKGWEHRGVSEPSTELVIRGPHEGFTEQLRVNTALVRRILKDEDLVAENISVGRRSHTPCSLLYIRDITNDSLVNEVRRRLKGIKLDYLIDSGELEQLLEDKTFVPAPQIIATERPDRVASFLSEGKVAIIMNGSPFALVMPATLPGLFHSSEDSYLRFPYGSFLRAIRFLGIMISLVLPGLYMAITNYHQEMIPTDLLFSIEAARESVPFPSIVEILIMEIAFELIREAGIRIPGAIGQTLGIIGALILGQAAVAADIVSPILIIIVAVTGLGSFAIPNFSLAITFRILRFAFIALGTMAGFLGISAGLFVYGLILVDAESFGVPFLVPFGPRTAGTLNDVLTRWPIWKQERRPDFLNTKDEVKQPKVSRQWDRKTTSKGHDDGKEEE